MRRLFQYTWAALAGGFLGGLFAESGQLPDPAAFSQVLAEVMGQSLS